MNNSDDSALEQVKAAKQAMVERARDANVNLAEKLKNRPWLRALLQLVPSGIGGAVDTLLIGRMENIQEERREAFFDELAQGDQDLTPEMAQSEPFLHAFLSTFYAAQRTRQRSKIRFFARLLRSATEDPPRVDLETEYEEFLRILEELSYREIGLVFLLAKYQEPFRQSARDQQALVKANLAAGRSAFEGRVSREPVGAQFDDNWKQAISEAKSRFEISDLLVRSMLSRLEARGLYRILQRGVGSGIGQTTFLYDRLAELIKLDESELTRSGSE